MSPPRTDEDRLRTWARVTPGAYVRVLGSRYGYTYAAGDYEAWEGYVTVDAAGDHFEIRVEAGPNQTPAEVYVGLIRRLETAGFTIP